LEKELIEKILALTASLTGMTPIYESNSIAPQYYIDETAQSEYRVYDSKQIVVPKYIVKPDPWLRTIEYIREENRYCLSIVLSGMKWLSN